LAAHRIQGDQPVEDGDRDPHAARTPRTARGRPPGDAEAAVKRRRIVSTVPKPHSRANHLDRRGTGLEGRSASFETKPH